MAKRHGLIEALRVACYFRLALRRYPWQNATASLKLILSAFVTSTNVWLSVAKRHGLIEATPSICNLYLEVRYPWQNATASLKQRLFFNGQGGS